MTRTAKKRYGIYSFFDGVDRIGGRIFYFSLGLFMTLISTFACMVPAIRGILVECEGKFVFLFTVGLAFFYAGANLIWGKRRFSDSGD